MPGRSMWGYSPRKASKPKVPDAVKHGVQVEADRIIEAFKPQCIRKPSDAPQFNYITDLHTKWRQNCIYLCATYTCPGPDALTPTFEAPFTRVEYAGGDRFHLAYMRYTGKWCEVFQDLTLTEVVAAIESEELFQPG